jgi:prevent-host-death family protein
VDEVVVNHQVLRVTRRNGGDFVVIAAEDWDALAETLTLNQVPGLVESIREAAAEPYEQGVRPQDVDW